MTVLAQTAIEAGKVAIDGFRNGLENPMPIPNFVKQLTPEERDIFAAQFLVLLNEGTHIEPKTKATTTEVNRFTQIVGQMAETYAKKNADYGNSFDISLDEDGLVAAKTRIGDKFNRFSSLIKKEAQVKDESMIDTLLDMANYCIMTVMWMEAREK